MQARDVARIKAAGNLADAALNGFNFSGAKFSSALIAFKPAVGGEIEMGMVIEGDTASLVEALEEAVRRLKNGDRGETH